MPRFEPPGHYTEEVPRSSTITGISATTAAFVGPTGRGPQDVSPPLTSLAGFQQLYGGDEGGEKAPTSNTLWHAARAYFAQGGKTLVIARTDIDDSGSDCLSTASGGSAVDPYLAALERLEAVEGISTVSAPGSTTQDTALAFDIATALIDHAERMRFRFALLDSIKGHAIKQLIDYRSRFDSRHAGFYAPWVSVADPLAAALLLLPPSGFVAGIIARIEAERGVAKVPANANINLALGFEHKISDGEQQQLNPLGINVLRSFVGHGHLLWGARTLSRDPEYKYISVQRTRAYIERAIEQGLVWAVHRANDQQLWQAVAGRVSTFLNEQWRQGVLIGTRPEQAFFVRCDATTMTPSDIDNGRLVCLVGLALHKPAEFVTLRVVCNTASSSS